MSEDPWATLWYVPYTCGLPHFYIVKTSFVKIVGGKDDYFVNVEIGEAVWYVPEDKEEASW